MLFEVRLDDGVMTDHQARTLVHALDHDGSGGKSKKSLENSLHTSQVVFVVLVVSVVLVVLVVLVSVCLFL